MKLFKIISFLALGLSLVSLSFSQRIEKSAQTIQISKPRYELKNIDFGINNAYSKTPCVFDNQTGFVYALENESTRLIRPVQVNDQALERPSLDDLFDQTRKKS